MSGADTLRLPEYLRYILEVIERISRYVGDMYEIAFLNDPRTQDDVIRNFEIIGEASRNIRRYHSQFADEHNCIPLDFAYEMRNALAHGYFKVDLQIVWKTIHISLPQLHQQVRQLLDEMK